jgi:hypothetical protein
MKQRKKCKLGHEGVLQEGMAVVGGVGIGAAGCMELVASVCRAQWRLPELARQVGWLDVARITTGSHAMFRNLMMLD